MRAARSLASHARLKARTMPACRAVGAAGGCDARRRRRAEEASWRHAAGGAADDPGDFGEGVAEDVVEDERDALGRGHRFEHDQEGHAHRLVEGDPVGRVAAVPPGRPLLHSAGSGSGSGTHSPT
jgi:hypothetical protein